MTVEYAHGGVSGGAGRPFGLNAGSFADSSYDTLAADTAAAAAAMPDVLARVAARQVQSAQFIADHGHEVVDGHTPIVEMIPPVLAGLDDPGSLNLGSAAYEPG